MQFIPDHLLLNVFQPLWLCSSKPQEYQASNPGNKGLHGEKTEVDEANYKQTRKTPSMQYVSRKKYGFNMNNKWQSWSSGMLKGRYVWLLYWHSDDIYWWQPKTYWREASVRLNSGTEGQRWRRRRREQRGTRWNFREKKGADGTTESKKVLLLNNSAGVKLHGPNVGSGI